MKVDHRTPSGKPSEGLPDNIGCGSLIPKAFGRGIAREFRSQLKHIRCKPSGMSILPENNILLKACA